MDRKTFSNNSKKQQSHNNPYMQSSAAIFNYTLLLNFFVFQRLRVHITLTSFQL